MWVRQRRLWWTSGETLLTTPHWPSTARLWRESAALNSWGCTSQRTSPGPPTPCQSPRRHNSAYTFSAGWKEQVSLHPSSPPSTGEPLSVCWPAASLSGTGTARPSSGQWTPLQKSSVPLSPPSWIFSLYDAPVKPIVSWRTEREGRRYRSIRARSTRLLNSFFPQAARALNSTHTAPLWNPMQMPYLLKTGPSHPLLLPLHHHRKNGQTFLCNSKCATHRWVGLYKPPVVTHSLLFSLDTFTHYCVYSLFTGSCTTNHLTLFPSQLLECFSFCKCKVFARHLHSLYFVSLCIGNHFYI